MKLLIIAIITTSNLITFAKSEFIREAGRCTMYGSCGRKGIFGGSLPCPDNELARKSEDSTFLSTLSSVCGPEFTSTTCCSLDQLETLASSLAQAEPLIATCPACRSNFRHFYCSFTCSPNQSQFMMVKELQSITNGGVTREAVKRLEVEVGSEFGEGFFNSCKDVKFGATNGYAMDLLGGGAKNYLAFLGYMGTERALGSPFQIDFLPDHTRSNITFDNSTETYPFNDSPLVCSSPELNARCACPDCPSVCASLPHIDSPAELASRVCKVGKMSCFSFFLVVIYAILLVGFTIGLGLREVIGRSGKKGGNSGGGDGTSWTTLRRRLSWRGNNTNGYDRVALEDNEYEDPSTSINARSDSASRPSPSNSLIGATSTNFDSAGEDIRRGGASNYSPATSLNRNRSSRGASLLDPSPSEISSNNPYLQPRTYTLNTYLTSAFYKLGLFCATRPYLTLSLGLLGCGIINLGWNNFAVEKDPVKLWVSRGSESEIAKNTFDEAFGPFYRTEQVFVSVAPGIQSDSQDGTSLDTTGIAKWQPVDSPVLNWETLQWWASVESSIRSLQSTPNNYTLKDVCFSPQTDPLPPQDSSACVVQSFMGYFGDSLDSISEASWAVNLNSCATTPVACLPGSGMPMNPKLVLGGIPSSEGEEGDQVELRASEARALVITYVVKNSLDLEVVAKAEEWEATLQAFLVDLAAPTSKARAELGLELAYSTGLSLEEELNESTNTDIPIVALSYIVMFLYVSMNLGSSGAGLLRSFARGLVILGRTLVSLLVSIPVLGRGRSRSASISSLTGSSTEIGAYFRRQLLVDSKFLLGLWGIIIVLLSVSTSVALFSAFGIKVTLIIAEVIPFLVLAIGVDNVFILSHELDQQNQKAYLTISRQGPFGTNTLDDMLEDEDVDGLPSAEERVARALGKMGPSILLSASCETVAFGLGAMVGMPAVRNFAIYAAGAVVVNAILQVTIFVSAMAINLRRVESNRVDCFPCFKLPTSTSMDRGGSHSEGYIARFIRTIYAPLLLKRPVKYFVIALFSGIFVLSWVGARHIELGLDQRLALPADSYLVNYFNALDAYLDVGPPVYFVTKGIDVSTRSVQQSVCGRFSTCDELSLANVLEAERKRPDSSFIAEPPAIWLDDFFQWLNPLLEDCCRVKKREPSIFCTAEDPDFACRPCYENAEPAWNITMDGLPEGEEFNRYLKQWLISPTDESCPLGGKAGYSSALKLNGSAVELSHFRTYHTPLKKQSDFINAFAAAQRVAADLSTRIGAEVFPYSLFYVFFDQYSHIVATTREVLSLALIAVFLVTSLLLGSWRTGSVVVFTVFLSVVSVMGVMGVWGISLNAISLVNLVISVGISVEFCSHIARAFMGAAGGGLPHDHPSGSKDRDSRAFTALVDVGSSVFSGITLTKLIGISVLALTRSKLLEVYFFRMWLALIVSGALHGLVFLPVALSFKGGQGYTLSSEDETWISSLVNESRPFLADDDDDDQSF